MRYDFSPGDRVVFRSWEDMEEEYGLDSRGCIQCKFNFVSDMRFLCGCEFTISWVDEDGEVGLEDFNYPFAISTAMIEPLSVDQDDLPDVSIDALMGVLDQ